MSIRISLEKIREGIEHALRKSAQHLAGAQACISEDIFDGAIALIEFAVEEFGRAVALREKLETGSEVVEKKLFESHVYKYNKAWTVLPSELKTVYEGSFDVTIFDPAIFDAGKESISPGTRLEAIFVGYNEVTGEWKTGIRANKQKLERLVEAIREHINNFKIPDQ